MEKPKYPSDEAEKFMVRLAPGLRTQLAEAAKKNGRSMNAELNARLLDSFGRAISLPKSLNDEVEQFALAEGLRFEDALSRVIVAGARSAATKVVHIEPHPDMSMDDLKKVLRAASQVLPPTTEVAYDGRPDGNRLVRREFSPESSRISDLAPTVARMERDIARLEVDKASETLTLRIVASTLRPLLDELPLDRTLQGILEGASVAEWKAICDAYLREKKVSRSELDAAFARLKGAEERLRALAPEDADPVWERIRAMREIASASDTPVPAGEGSGSNKPASRKRVVSVRRTHS